MESMDSQSLISQSMDETFMPHNPLSSQTSVVNESTIKHEQSHDSNENTQAMAMMATANQQMAYT